MRQLLTVILSIGALTSSARAQDRVTYRDKSTNKDTVATGTIQAETAARIIIKGTTTKEVPANEVLDVSYEVPGAIRLDYGRLSGLEKTLDGLVKTDERIKALGELIKNYQAILPQLAGDKLKFARRQVQYKIASAASRLAEEDSEQVGKAIESLAAFKQENPDSWQITPAMKQLARLQIGKSDTAGALKTYQELASIPGISRETARECNLLMAHALIEGKNYAEARKRLETLQKAYPPNDPQSVRVQVYLAECLAGSGEIAKAVPQIEGIIAKTNDSAIKAVAYNALGDCYRLNGRPKEALWAYLFVDILYHHDRQEHVKAIGHLAKLFDELGDGARAAQYKEKLKKEGR